jgi:hypothetical protein
MGAVATRGGLGRYHPYRIGIAMGAAQGNPVRPTLQP